MIESDNDKIFDEKIQRAKDFEFDENVASVFDDMVGRSVPYYGEIQRMITELAAEYSVNDTNIFDLGCSTGTTIINIAEVISDNVHIIGIDDSQEMLDRCRTKMDRLGVTNYTLQCSDITYNGLINNASVVILCLTLQFVRPLQRESILKNIINGMNNGGALILVEKIIAEDSTLNRCFIEYYYNYKRRMHYSDLEISQKRESLENILIPYKLSENIQMLHKAGFTHIEEFFKWYNFSGLIAIK